MASKTIPPWKLYELENGPFTEDEVFIRVGVTLFTLHQFELTLRVCTAMMQSAALSDKDDVIDRFWTMKKATCGTLAVKMREVVQIAPAFDQILSRLIRRRNAFAHKLTAHTPFKPSAGNAWLRNVPRFLWALRTDLIQVEDVFLAYLQTCLAHSDQPYPANLISPSSDPFLGFQPGKKFAVNSSYSYAF